MSQAVLLRQTTIQAPASVRRVKVLMLTDYPYVAEDEGFGGVMQASFRLVGGLDARNDPRIELYVLTQSPHVQRRTVRRLEGNTTVMYFPLERRLSNVVLFGYPAVRGALREALEAIKPDLVHGQGTAKYLYAATHAPVPHIVTLHGIYQNEMKVVRSRLTVGERIARFVKMRLERYYVRRIDRLIAITDEVSSFVRRYSPEARIVPINNAIDDRFFAIAPLRDGQAPVVLFVAAITYRKGLDYLLAAFARVLRAIPAAQLRIAGIWDWDPSYVAALKSEYRSLIEQGAVAFLGGITQEQLVEEFEGASLLCLPSRAESAPMVISQAMAAARPVVASRVGGVPGMIDDGVTGFLWDIGNVERLADLLLEALADLEAARKMGDAARAVAAQRYSIAAVTSRTIEAYLDAVAASAVAEAGK